jgi:hypothetical protein
VLNLLCRVRDEHGSFKNTILFSVFHKGIRESDYSEILIKINEIYKTITDTELSCYLLTTDQELSLRNSCKNHIKHKFIRNCAFHFAKNIKDNLRKVGITVENLKTGEIKNIYYLCRALILINKEFVVPLIDFFIKVNNNSIDRILVIIEEFALISFDFKCSFRDKKRDVNKLSKWRHEKGVMRLSFGKVPKYR